MRCQVGNYLYGVLRHLNISAYGIHGEMCFVSVSVGFHHPDHMLQLQCSTKMSDTVCNGCQGQRSTLDLHKRWSCGTSKRVSAGVDDVIITVKMMP